LEKFTDVWTFVWVTTELDTTPLTTTMLDPAFTAEVAALTIVHPLADL